MLINVDGFSEGADGTTTFASARDFGNAGAGFVAGRKNIPFVAAMLAFSALESKQSGKPSIEAPTTVWAERLGYKAGTQVRRQEDQIKIKKGLGK